MFTLEGRSTQRGGPPQGVPLYMYLFVFGERGNRKLLIRDFCPKSFGPLNG